MPDDASEIYVLGRQWMWELRHPEGKREINELHVPVGRPVRLTMTSQDVIHSFYIPAFRIKQDVVPGRYTSLWFQPTKPGRYHLFCAEYCGTKHSGMIGSVVVMEPSEYQQWLEEGDGRRSRCRSPASGCSGGWAAAAATAPTRRSGRPCSTASTATRCRSRRAAFVTADERYIRDSILLPQSQVVAGYEPVMPTFQGHISEDELLKIIAYIKAIGKNGEGRAMSAAVAWSPRPTNYLTASYGVKSWLLTTDHKRIGILYMISITLFFFVGGAAATLMRLELMTPAGDVVQPETYNKLFTLHGVVMVFFFLIPSIPAVLGNFLVPIMIGARDLAFPKINLASWYIYMLGGVVHALGGPDRRGRHRLDVLHAVFAACSRTRRSCRRRWACSSSGSRRSSPG